MSNMMRALVKAKAEPGIWMQQVPVPEIGPNDVLIKIRKTAICGTDVHIYNWDQWAQKTVPVPMVTGHEFVGTVADFGAAVTEYKVGQRVSGEGHIVCGHCRNCRAGRGHLCRNTLGVGVHRPGAFGEYLSIPQHNVVPIPDDVPDEIAAIFDPLGNAVHTALSFDLVGEDVLVTGAGPIGIMGALVAQCVGARKVVITDINPTRLALARKLGVRHVVDASKEKLKDVMRDIGMHEGFDVGLEMSGAAPAFRDMIDTMNNGGKIAILGIAPDRLRDRLEQGDLQDAASEGHLRPRDVRDLVQDDRAGAGPARRQRADHPPHRRGRLHRGLRGDEERQLRQGGDGLVGGATSVGHDSCDALAGSGRRQPPVERCHRGHSPHPRRTASVFVIFVAHLQDVVCCDPRFGQRGAKRSHRLDGFADVFAPAVDFRRQARDRTTMPRDHDRLTALDIVKESKEVGPGLRRLYLSNAHCFHRSFQLLDIGASGPLGARGYLRR